MKRPEAFDIATEGLRQLVQMSREGQRCCEGAVASLGGEGLIEDAIAELNLSRAFEVRLASEGAGETSEPKTPWVEVEPL